MAFFIPTQWNLQVYDSTGWRVPQRSSSLAETADIFGSSAGIPASLVRSVMADAKRFTNYGLASNMLVSAQSQVLMANIAQ